MRETKDQTILRLKRRVTELEGELKTFKSQARAYKKECRLDYAEVEAKYKQQIAKLQAEISEKYERWNSERQDLEKRLATAESHLKRINESERQKRLKEDEKWEAYQEQEWLKECRRYNDSRLEYYNLGLYCGKDHYNFINPWFLTLNINPHTGAKLNVGGTTSILNIIKDNPYYQQKIEAVKPYLDAADDEDPEALSFIDSIGRDIYEKLYPDFPFEEYSI